MTSTDPLMTFLRARLDEDEQVARKAANGHGEWAGFVRDDIAGCTVYDDQWLVATINRYSHNAPYSNKPDAVGPQYRNDAADSTSLHIARHDPARVLADVDAKRRIIEYAEEANQLDWQQDSDRRIGTRDEVAEPYVGDSILRLLAMPYADHPDYREDWRP